MLKIYTIAAFIWLSLVASSPSQVPDKYKDLRWYAAETQNFEIRAMSKTHALELKARVESLKSWIHDRWMLHDVPFNKKCMIMCASNETQFQEFWKHDVDPKVAVSKDKDGNDRNVYAIWIAANDDGSWLTSSLPEKVGRACLLNYESVHGTKIGVWAHVGMSALNNDVSTIARLLQMSEPKNAINATTILVVTPEEYAGKTAAEKLEFKQQATIFTLFLRKEFGIKSFLAFVDSGSTRSIQQIYGFENTDQFESAYHAYSRNLSHDLRTGVTPTSYLTWSFVKKRQP